MYYDYVDNLQIGENDEFVMKELEDSIRYSDTKLRRIIEFLDMLPEEELNDELAEELKSLKVELKDIYGQNQHEPIKWLYREDKKKLSRLSAKCIDNPYSFEEEIEDEFEL